METDGRKDAYSFVFKQPKEKKKRSTVGHLGPAFLIFTADVGPIKSFLAKFGAPALLLLSADGRVEGITSYSENLNVCWNPHSPHFSPGTCRCEILN